LKELGSLVAATVNDSILNPRAENSPETLESAPDSFSNCIEIMCLILIPSLGLNHLLMPFHHDLLTTFHGGLRQMESLEIHFQLDR